MEIEKNWPEICKVFKASKLMCAVATVSSEGEPHVAPIGSVHLNRDTTGLFFDHYTVKTSENIEAASRICVMACDMRPGTWLAAMMNGAFKTPPAVRISGTAGKKREATQQEKERFMNQVKIFRRFKGHDLLWKNLSHVRDVTFDTFDPVVVGRMTRDLWKT